MNKKGFTLLELIIVLVVVGALASVALPKYFKTIEYARNLEAVRNLSIIRQALQTCYARSRDYRVCAQPPVYMAIDWNKLHIDRPGLDVDEHFDYEGFVVKDDYLVQANRNTFEGGNNSDFIAMETLAGGGVGICGTGAFKGLGEGPACTPMMLF